MKRDPNEEFRLLAGQLGVDAEFLRDCVRHGVLIVEEPEISAAQLARLRRLRRLCDALTLDVFAGSLIVDLLEQRDALLRDLHRPHAGE
ncbi:MAG: hypothetical protein KGL74_09605 [Elusimicrobia bacterium]|nr:hypothetical protein [Elusimicrobiota bacterium]